jgi:hypothetical protein
LDEVNKLVKEEEEKREAEEKAANEKKMLTMNEEQRKSSRNTSQNTKRRKHYIKKKLVCGLKTKDLMIVTMIQMLKIHLHHAGRSIHQQITTNLMLELLNKKLKKLRTLENKLNLE